MISVIYGAKGSGKTKRIIDATNAASEKATGQVIFIKGMLATNFDIQHVFIDGMSRLLDLPADELKPAFDAMEKVDGVEFVVSVSADKLPKYLEKFAVK